MGISLRQGPYVMEIDRERNCFACERFGHIARHCRNREQRGRIMDRRRVEYSGRFEGNIEPIEHLKEVENLEVLD